MRHANRVKLARFSSDGHWVATGSEDGTARIWDAQSGFPATEPLMHYKMVTSLVWLPDSRRLLTGPQDGRIRLWKLQEIDSVPIWLAGKRDDGKGGHVSVPTEHLDPSPARDHQRRRDTRKPLAPLVPDRSGSSLTDLSFFHRRPRVIPFIKVCHCRGERHHGEEPVNRAGGKTVDTLMLKSWRSVISTRPKNQRGNRHAD
jgi:WD40 repeat protein